MKPSRVVGIGCFGRSQAFSKFFSKILENYSLSLVDAMAGCKKFDTMIDGATDFIPKDGYAVPSRRSIEPRVTTDRITGFYIAFIDNGPRLSVFVPSPGKKPNIKAASLTAF